MINWVMSASKERDPGMNYPIPGNGRIFLFSTTSEPSRGPTLAVIQLAPVFYVGEKRPEREADYLIPSPPLGFNLWCLGTGTNLQFS
jgi:hypothetical protein